MKSYHSFRFLADGTSTRHLLAVPSVPVVPSCFRLTQLILYQKTYFKAWQFKSVQTVQLSIGICQMGYMATYSYKLGNWGPVWSGIVRCGPMRCRLRPMWSDVVISHTPRRCRCFDCRVVIWRRFDSVRLCCNLSAAGFRLGRPLLAVFPLSFGRHLLLLFRQQFVWLFIFVHEQIKAIVSRHAERHRQPDDKGVEFGATSRDLSEK